MIQKLIDLEQRTQMRQTLPAGMMIESAGTNLYATGDNDLIELNALLGENWHRYVGVKLAGEVAEEFIAKHGDQLKAMSSRRWAVGHKSPGRPPMLAWNHTYQYGRDESKEASSQRTATCQNFYSPVPVTDSGQLPPHEITADDLRLDELLVRLKDTETPPTADLLRNLLKLQFYRIPTQQLEPVVDALLVFIRTHRHSDRMDVLVGVTAAIRKVLLNLESSELSVAAELIKTDGRLLVPIEIELEVAKMVVQRIRNEPEIKTEALSELASLLAENAKFYSTPKMVLRDRYGATALNSLLAVVLMRYAKSGALYEDIASCAPSWFLDSVRSRLRRYSKSLAVSNVDGASDLAKWIGGLAFMASIR